MSTKFILIENPGVAPTEGFTLLGASTKAELADPKVIGKFGSGTKLGTIALIRDGYTPIIYCGTERLEFGTKPIQIEGAEHRQITVRRSGKSAAGRSINRTDALSVTLGYGKQDWTDPKLAIREFISNALDAVEGNPNLVTVRVVEDTAVRAKEGCTRVYIPYTDDTAEIVLCLSEWFLHWAGVDVAESAILQKKHPGKARIYRRGVYVRTVTFAKESLNDYNLNDLLLNESRTSSDFDVGYYAAKLWQEKATASQILALVGLHNVWESQFRLHFADYENPSPAIVKSRKEVWEEVRHRLPKQAVIQGVNENDTLVRGKGYQPLRVADAFLQASRYYQLPTLQNFLTSDERAGRIVDEVTNPLVITHVQAVWQLLQNLQADRGRPCPTIRSFNHEMDAGSITKGYWRESTVYINNSIVGNDLTRELLATIVEELGHHITQATDNSRDFQEFAFQLAAKLLLLKGL